MTGHLAQHLDEQLKLSEKASSGLIDISGKMLMLPVVISIGRFSVEVSAAYISVLTLITGVILWSSLYVQKKQLNNIKNSNEIAFSDLDVKILHESDEQIKSDLRGIRKNLKKTTFAVKAALNIYTLICIVAIVYSLHLFFDTEIAKEAIERAKSLIMPLPMPLL